MKNKEELQRTAKRVGSEEKYAAFDDSVMAAAQRQADSILKAARAEAEQMYQKLTAPQRTDPVALYRAEAEAALARKVAFAQQENRKKLLVYRQQLVNALFAEAEENLEAYAETPAYVADMERRLAACARRAQGHTPAVVYVRRGDETRLAAAAAKVFPGCPVKADGRIRLGGFKLAADGVLFDETLDFAADAERERFLSRCGLRVDQGETKTV